MTNSIGEVVDTDCMFVIGSNTTENHPIIGAKMKQALKKGAKLIVADPRRIELADYADVFLQLKPGTNIALLNGIMNVIIEKGLYDQKYIEERCENFEELVELAKIWLKPLAEVFPIEPVQHVDNKMMDLPQKSTINERKIKRTAKGIVKPKVLIPIFPGTNCEYDMAKAFEDAGAKTEIMVFRNLTPADIKESIEKLTKEIGDSQILALPGGFSSGEEPFGTGKFIAAIFRNPYVTDATMRLLQQRDGLILGISNGFQALVKLGLVPYGEIRELKSDSPTLTSNTLGRHVSCMVNTIVESNLSPWFNKVKVGDIHTIPVSHGEGRFVASDDELNRLMKSGQIATRYIDLEGNPTMDIKYNPNGSLAAVEGITSPDGRVLGKMGHSERVDCGTLINIPGNKDQKIFESGVEYFI